MNILNDYRRKVQVNGANLRQSRLAVFTQVVNDDFRDMPEYVPTKRNPLLDITHDFWWYSNSSYKMIVGDKTVILAPYEDNSWFYSGIYLYPQSNFNGTWLVTSTDNQYDNKTKGIVKEATLTIRFYDLDGVLREYPSVIESPSKAEGLDEDPYTIITKNSFLLKMPQDEFTRLLKEGDKLIINHEFAYRISTKNTFESRTLLTLRMDKYEINTDTDNLTLGVANYTNRPIFDLSILSNDLSSLSGETIDLEYALNEAQTGPSGRPVIWSSSDTNVATVDENGVVSTIAEGVTTITIAMENNADVTSSVELTVAAVVADDRQLVVTPDVDYLNRRQEETFTVQRLNNGVEEVGTFTIALNESETTADSRYYTFATVGTNQFTVTNLRPSGNIVIEIQDNDFPVLSRKVTIETRGY